MERFKGTKGKWYVNNYAGDFIIEDGENYESNILTSSDNLDETEAKANAQLMCKAPEMLEELIETVKDLNVLLGNVAESCKVDPKWEGMYDIISEWKVRKEQLIKEATEL